MKGSVVISLIIRVKFERNGISIYNIVEVPTCYYK